MGGAETVRHYATRVTTEVGAWTHQVKSSTNASVKLSRLKRIQRSWFLIALRSQETSGEHAMSGFRALFSGCRGSRGDRIFHRKLLSQNFPSNTGCFLGPRSALGNLILLLHLSSAVLLCKQNLWLKCVARRCAMRCYWLRLYFGSVSQDVTLRKVVIRTRELSPCSLRIGTCMYLNGESHTTPTYKLAFWCLLRRVVFWGLR